MESMYERLMNLPLFKGASEEIINNFVESTPLEFKRFRTGEVIIKESQLCNEVVCLLSGSVKRETKYCCGRLIVSEVLKEGSLLGVVHLFGLFKRYNMKVTAREDVGIMCIPKNHYIRLMRGSQLLLINYLNYISRFAQNGQDALRLHLLGGPDSEVSYLTQITTSPSATDIYLTSPGQPINEFLSPSCDVVNHDFESLIESNLVELIDRHTLRIRSRSDLLEYYRCE